MENTGWILLAAYFIPAIIAILRRHQQVGPIVVVNLLLGWTFIGWIVALAWCFSNVTKPPVGPPNPQRQLPPSGLTGQTFR